MSVIEQIPVVALRRTTVLPNMIVHLDVSREITIQAIEAAILTDQKIFLVTQKSFTVEKPSMTDLYSVGTVCVVRQVAKLSENLIRVLIEGIEKGELMSLQQEDPFLQGRVSLFAVEDTEQITDTMQEAMLRSLRELFQAYSMVSGKIGRELLAQILEIEDIRELITQIGIQLPLLYTQRQQYLEAVTLTQRYEVLGTILSQEISVFQARLELQEKVKEKVDKNQREYYLREQMKMIREELGEGDSVYESEVFLERLEKLEATEDVKAKIKKEIVRYKSMGNQAPDSSVSRGYIDTLLSLPWEKVSADSTDLKRAWKILQQDHYGLEKVKTRIMEYLAVRILTKKGNAPILCLVGPPGTGKTSIGKSIARALDKKYTRLSLGGVRDEAEIRGHRRTYVGAFPGRIINSLKQAGVKNPLMLLDEIDKVSADYRGDTASALLEVLDAEQNSHFVDHYVEIPVDLSEVLFIATANDPQTIPQPLLDRMEVIEITSYTENEKEHIARGHLIPKQKVVHGLTSRQLQIKPAALRLIIRGYTREAGVRNLERKIGSICRKATREILEDGVEQVVVTPENLEQYLGQARVRYRMANKKNAVGIARGLAWTSVGGDTLQIEVSTMPGKGDIQLTGQLGDVMKESAKIGISYIRSVAASYKIPDNYFSTHDLHIHIPEGAVPKDGPSAGITMATAIISAITNVPVNAKLAMTGEITLRGRVLPIGGLKEKLLAAKNAKIKTVLVPADNEKDVNEISDEIKKGLTILPVESMQDVLQEALVSGRREV
ncbi:MAG: endopeptidase La [Lachnospiraceae bacterium]